MDTFRDDEAAVKLLSIVLMALVASGCVSTISDADSPQKTDAIGLRKPVVHEHKIIAPETPPPAAFLEGREAHEYGRFEYAMAILSPLAQAGVAPAQALVGYMYANAEGVERDDATAVSWFRKAAEQGDPDGQANLGFMYANGRGVAMSKDEAMKWYLYAAEQGNVGAQYNLSSIGTARPIIFGGAKQGIESIVDHANAGDRDAMYVLGHNYVTGNSVRQDVVAGMEWIKKSANLGSAAAQYRYGRYLSEGSYGLAIDESQGRAWIEKSAKQGYLEAKQWLETRNAVSAQMPTPHAQ